jgi:hypothetical protein
MLLQNIGHAGRGNFMTHIRQGTLNAVITPGGILLGEAHHQIANLLGERRASWLLVPTVAVVPLSSDQPPMPAQDGVRGEEGTNLSQELAAKDFPFDSQAAALVIVQQDPALAEFLTEHLVLGPEIIDDLLLLVIDPAGKDEMEQLPRLEDKVHGGPVAEEENGLASGLGPDLSMGRKWSIG